MASSKSSRPTPSRFGRHKALWTTFTILCVLVLAALTTVAIIHDHNQKAIAADQARFAQADSNINLLSNQLRLKIGEPVKSSKVHNCTKPSVEFGVAPLFCSTGFTFFYPTVDANSATSVLNSAKELVEGAWQLTATNTSNTSQGQFDFSKLSSDSPSSSYESIDHNYIDQKINLKSSISVILYAAPNPPFQDYLKSNDTNYLLAITLQYKDKARQAYYF